MSSLITDTFYNQLKWRQIYDLHSVSKDQYMSDQR